MMFIADRTVGKLASRLRILGFDVLYWSGGTLEEAAKAALSKGRVLLTRSHRLKEKAEGLQILVVEANDARGQIREVLLKLNLLPEKNKLFSICLMCNEKLLEVTKEEVEGRVPDFIYQSYNLFHICPRCQRVYWPGTHFQRMKKEMAEMAVKD